MNLKKTIFLDIDGTLIRHTGSLDGQLEITELLSGVKEKLQQWNLEESLIILTTGRKESMRKATEKQLASLGIHYDQLIMGIGRGMRIVINDKKPNSTEWTCDAYSPERNTGLDNCPY